MIHGSGINRSLPSCKWIIPIFHIPILGGWKNYIVIQPLNGSNSWHIGWITKDVIGVSQIEIRGPARLLLAKDDSLFFGISSKDNNQIPLQKIGEGYIGDNGPFKNLPLL